MCNRNHFFEDNEEASAYIADKPGMIIVPVLDGFDLARRAFIEPVLKLTM